MSEVVGVVSLDKQAEFSRELRTQVLLALDRERSARAAVQGLSVEVSSDRRALVLDTAAEARGHVLALLDVVRIWRSVGGGIAPDPEEV